MPYLRTVVLCTMLLLGLPTKTKDPKFVVPKVMKPVVNLRDSVVQLARKQLGRQYVLGASSPRRGFDCSGLVQYVMQAIHQKMPRTAREQARVGRPVLDSLLPGDLLFFGHTHVQHVGIYTGAGHYINASSVAGMVIERPLNRHWLLGARHVLDTN